MDELVGLCTNALMGPSVVMAGVVVVTVVKAGAPGTRLFAAKEGEKTAALHISGHI
jgi:hypothetical protein